MDPYTHDNHAALARKTNRHLTQQPCTVLQSQGVPDIDSQPLLSWQLADMNMLSQCSMKYISQHSLLLYTEQTVAPYNGTDFNARHEKMDVAKFHQNYIIFIHYIFTLSFQTLIMQTINFVQSCIKLPLVKNYHSTY